MQTPENENPFESPSPRSPERRGKTDRYVSLTWLLPLAGLLVDKIFFKLMPNPLLQLIIFATTVLLVLGGTLFLLRALLFTRPWSAWPHLLAAVLVNFYMLIFVTAAITTAIKYISTNYPAP